MKNFILCLAVFFSALLTSASPSKDSTSIMVQSADSTAVFNCAEGETEYIDVMNFPPQANYAVADPDYRAKLIKNTILGLGVTLMFISGCIAILWLLLHFRRMQYLDRLHIVDKSLELDRPLPKEFFMTGYKPVYKKVSSGICWIGAGLSVIVFFMLVDAEVWALGILLIFIGLANIASYIIATRSSRKD